MADGVELDAGTGGATVATDDAGAAGHVQIIKLAVSADGSAVVIPADETNGLDVDVTRLPSLPAGANAIGKLAANSGVDIGDVDVTSEPATAADAGSLPSVQKIVGGYDGTNTQVLKTDADGILQVDNNVPLAATVDTVTAKLATDKIHDGTTALTPKFAIIDAASSGDNTIVSAVNPKKLRVLSLFVVAAAAVTVRFESGAGGTALTGQMVLAANGGFALPFNPVGWFETASNTLLNLELSGAVSVDGSLTYVEV